jgi:hypothetical protein
MQLDSSIPDDPEALRVWLLKQPPEVQEAALLFPILRPIYIRDVTYWVVGYAPPEGKATVAALVCIKRDPKTITHEEFHALVRECDLLDPQAIKEISTRH